MFLPLVAVVFLRELHRYGLGRRAPAPTWIDSTGALLDPRLNGLFTQPVVVVFFTLLLYSILMRATKQWRRQNQSRNFTLHQLEYQTAPRNPEIILVTNMSPEEVEAACRNLSRQMYPLEITAHRFDEITE